jgi:hypothetical protein
MARLLSVYDEVSDAKRGWRRHGTTWLERIDLNLHELAGLGGSGRCGRTGEYRPRQDAARQGRYHRHGTGPSSSMRRRPPLNHEWRYSCRGKAKRNGQQRCQRTVELWIRERGVHYCRFHGGAWSAAGLKARRTLVHGSV